MIDLKNFTSAISQIEEEKGISKDKILETVEMAIAAAYKKDYGEKGQLIRSKLDPDTGKFDIWQEKIVVDESMIKSDEEIAEEEAARERGEVIEHDQEDEDTPRKVRFNEEKHIMLDEAKKIDEDAELEGVVRFDVEVQEDFGRIAAQTAKQVIIQRIREAERDAVYEEFEDKVDGIVSGIVQRVEGNTVFFDLGKTTGIMTAKDRIPGERYRVGQRLRLYVVSLEKGPRGPQILVSRSHPKMLSRLFELEVPEITAGTVEIKALAREAGARSKIAVVSTEEGIDPIGSCVGQRGTRVSAVIQELGGEKIDIIEWAEDPEVFIANSLSPARVLDVEADNNRAEVFVAEDQLSLAIGKDGQNVRLAAKLTGWKIDIVSKETGEVKSSDNEEEQSEESDESENNDAEKASDDKGEEKENTKDTEEDNEVSTEESKKEDDSEKENDEEEEEEE
ncbi:MAG: transcription termination factor NusA [Candidatus Spechtbacterales bacterium]|nr:transcription termination factor NusA [Candidatus Spechtbacterales bacterium]